MSRMKLEFPAAGRIAVLTGMACVACCALPLVGIAVGSATLAGLAAYSELAALVFLGLGGLGWLASRIINKPAPACDIKGPCAPAKSDATR